MVSFLVRRVIVSVLILVAASFIMFVLAANSGDPLQDLRTTNAPNREQLIAQRSEVLRLDLPVPLRWANWLGGATGCLIPGAQLCDLGRTISGSAVLTVLPTAMSSTVVLVTAATVFAVILGILVGVITALRQNTPFDLGVTLFSFFLYSLPSFLIAVLLKEFIAIRFNDFLVAGGQLGPGMVLGAGLAFGGAVALFSRGTRRRRWALFAIAAAASAGTLGGLSLSGWFVRPGLGPIGLSLGVLGTAAVTVLLMDVWRGRMRWIAGGAALAGLLGCVLVQGALERGSWPIIFGIVFGFLGCGVLAGLLTGGQERATAARIGGVVLAAAGLLAVVDRFIREWPAYVANPRVSGRPIATVGSETPGLSGDLWTVGMDRFTHLLLPTLALMLISFAAYTRYSRAGMLEVLDQDYIRTARAKGLPERTVIARHALRNTLIPVATIVATDIGSLLGGAVIAEHVFAIPGMGQLFNTSLRLVDLNPIMGYFLVIAIMAITFNILADLAYAALDPRVRVRG